MVSFLSQLRQTAYYSCDTGLIWIAEQIKDVDVDEDVWNQAK